MALGTVKWFQRREELRVHQPRGRRKDIFVHHSAILGEGFKSLSEGSLVEFEIVEGAKGLEAKNVVRPST